MAERELTYGEAVREAIAEEMWRDLPHAWVSHIPGLKVALPSFKTKFLDRPVVRAVRGRNG